MDIKSEIVLFAGNFGSYLEASLPASQNHYPPELYEAMAYSLLSGGKRIRPFLAHSVYSLFSRDDRLVMPLCAALEMIHTYSLIHDDLPCMDDDSIRRGKPASHIKFGEAQALLTGDALLTEAFRSLSITKGIEESKVLYMIRALSEAAGCRGMVGGQYADIISQGEEIQLPVLEFIHMNKTGELIRVSCECGAVAGGAGEAQIAAASEYGKWLGFTFQIVDDILDEVSESGIMGKTTGKDKEQGKLTYPGYFGIEESRRLADEYALKAKKALSGLPGEVKPLYLLTDYLTERMN